MPLYSFRCPQCGIFDAIFSMQDCPNAQDCPVCEQLSSKMITPIRLSLASSSAMQLTDFCHNTAENPPIVQGNLPAQTSSHLHKRKNNHSTQRKVSLSPNPLHHTLPKP